MSNTSSNDLTAQALAETQHIIDGLSQIDGHFTVVSAYLHSADKNPSVFLQKLEKLFETKILVSPRPKTILNQLNAAWGKCVKADPNVPFSPSAPHTFLGAIHPLPELWSAEVNIGHVPQSLFLPPSRLSYNK